MTPADPDEIHEGQVEPPAGLRVVPGHGQGPSATPSFGCPRAGLLAFLRQAHRGHRERRTGELLPWTVINVIHERSGRELGNWPVRPDEDDVELGAEINARIESHGLPIARREGPQLYEINAYFEGMGTTPGAQHVEEVIASASLNFQGPLSSLRQDARHGSMTPHEAQALRHNEFLLAATFDLTKYNVDGIQAQLDKAYARIQVLEARETEIRDREDAIRKADHEHQITLMREERSAKRKDWIVARLGQYVPVFAAKLDQKIFGLSQATPDDKDRQALDILQMLFEKFSDPKVGQNRMAALIQDMGFTDVEVSKIEDMMKLLWIQNAQVKMQREASVQASGGGFASLGRDLVDIATRGEVQAAQAIQGQQAGQGQG